MRQKGSCRRADGKQKIRHRNGTEARIVAARRTSETGILHEAYDCRHCHRWHIGKTSGSAAMAKARIFEAEAAEYGDRVFWCLWLENAPNIGTRHRTISDRCAARERRLAA